MVNAFFYPYLGGIEKHMYEIAKRIAKTDEVHVITSQLENTASEEQIENIFIHRMPSRYFKFPVLCPPPFVVSPRVKKKIKTLDSVYDFDAFALHSRYMPDFTYVLKYAKKVNKFSTFTVHDQRFIGINPFIDGVADAYDNVFGVKTISQASKFIAVSNSVVQDLEFYEFKKDKIKMIYNGVDTDFFKKSTKTYREKYAQGFNNLIVFAGRIVIQKGIQYLIEAMPKILEAHPKTKLLIVGTGSFEIYLRMLVRKLHLKKNVEFAGFIPEKDLPDMYSSADVFVAPSLIEPFGMVILESMSCGTPVVTCNIGGIPEVIGDCGLLVKSKDSTSLANSINLLLSDSDLRKKFSKKGRERAEKMFTWDLVAKQTRNFYLENLS